MPQPTDSRILHDFLVIHRWQWPLPVAYLCYAGWGIAYAAPGLDHIPLLATVAVILANLFLFASGLALNTIADIDTDSRHGDKNYLTKAVFRVGVVRTRRWVTGEIAAGLACAVSSAFLTGRPLVFVYAVTTAILHWSYNVEPVRLKHRGFPGAIAFGACSAALPCLTAFTAVAAGAGLPGLPVLLVFLGLGVLSGGRTAWWSVPDAEADAAAGAATPTVRHGTRRAVGLSCLIMLAGLVLIASGLRALSGPLWAIAGIAPHLLVLAFAARPLLATEHGDLLPSSAWLRTRGLPLVTLGEVVLLGVPLAAAAP
ncbi:UbiA family prenyltransferase [Amycolatopsis rhizosphaerae]|nr:UbiA family prenyltransferase [Amycolatopsis rhizosphaerae]